MKRFVAHLQSNNAAGGGYLKYLKVIWPLPITVFGLMLAGIVQITGGACKRYGNALEASNGAASRLLWLMNPWADIEAITLGHVILARDPATAKRLRIHEHTHVRQYERWGVIFPFAYLASSALAVMKGGDAYRDNVFEREAFEAQFFQRENTKL